MNTLTQLHRWHFALRNLVLKDFRVRYRNMALGLLWSVINPLVMLGVLTFIFTYVYPTRTQKAFPVFVLLGLVIFNLFSRTVVTATVSVQENAALVKKVAFPRQLIPFSVIISQMLDGLIMIGLLIVFIFLFHIPITAYFLWLPLIYGVLFVFIAGISLITCAMNVYFRDMRYLVESGMTILFWLTPVFYSLDKIRDSLPRWMYLLYLFNPLAGCIDAARQTVLHATTPNLATFGASVLISAGTFIFATSFFRRMQRRFADFT